ncbi:MAG: TonB family protein [Luteitalea sp.]|nr:TonB family protein [Luteitalea sp.]
MAALRRNLAWILCLIPLILPLGTRAQGLLERAQALYASAQFAAALAILKNVQPATQAEAVAATKTRALCLLALGESAQAERAFEALVAADPAARLTEAEAAPRVRALFAKVRVRVLPPLVRQRFAVAKELFSNGNDAEAAVAFRELSPLIDDPDLATAGVTGLSDLRVLVDGFLALADAADKKPSSGKPVSRTPDSTDIPNGGERSEGAEARRSTPPAIVPPVVISQPIPQPRGITLRRKPATLVIEVLIDEQGRVERARLQQPLHPTYDKMVLAAVDDWRYQPATRDGRPVKFLKTIEVTLHP